MAKKNKSFDDSAIWDNVCGIISKKRAAELKKLLTKHPELSKREIVNQVLLNPKPYPELYQIIAGIDPELAVENEQIRKMGGALRRIKNKFLHDEQSGRSFQVFDSVRVKDTNNWVVKFAYECALDPYYRKQILDRHEVRRAAAVVATETFKDYVSLVNHL